MKVSEMRPNDGFNYPEKNKNVKFKQVTHAHKRTSNNNKNIYSERAKKKTREVIEIYANKLSQ